MRTRAGYGMGVSSPVVLKPQHPCALGSGRHGEDKQPAEQGDPSCLRGGLPHHGTGLLVSPTRHRVPGASPSLALLPLPPYPDLDFSRVSRIGAMNACLVKCRSARFNRAPDILDVM